MPRPVGYGRPGTPVFPPGWSAAAAGVMNKTHEAAITIGHPGTTPTWDEENRRTTASPIPPAYTGPATVRPASDSDGHSERVVAEDPVTVTSYQVALPQLTAGIETGMVVTVTTSPDPALARRTLTVVGVEYGDRRFTRILYATLND